MELTTLETEISDGLLPLEAEALLRATEIFLYIDVTACVLTMIINPLTVIAMVLHGMLKKTVTNLFIASLCCSDFIVGLALFLVELPGLLGNNFTNTKFLAETSWAAAGLTGYGYYSSLFTALIIGVDRAIATITPLKYRSRVTRKRGMVALALQWSVVSCLVLGGMFTKLGSLDKGQPLPLIINAPSAYHQAFLQYVSTPMIFTCLVGNVLLYTAIVIAFNRTTKKISSSSDKQSHRLTKMSVIVVSSLLVSTAPVTILAAFPPPTNLRQQMRVDMIYNILKMVIMLPTFCNNFIYAWHLSEFRKAYGQLLKCRRPTTVHPDQGTVDTSASANTERQQQPHDRAAKSPRH